MADLGTWTDLNPVEKTRRYLFPNGEAVFEDVRRVLVRPSGTHRLETGDGKKHIVSGGWIAISIDAESWTF